MGREVNQTDNRWIRTGFSNYCSAITMGDKNAWSILLSKDAPGLDYFLEGRPNLITEPWQPLVSTAVDTNTVWSTEFDLPPGSESGFYRLRTTPSAGSSPPWPGQ